jgi:hypothetical protein
LSFFIETNLEKQRVRTFLYSILIALAGLVVAFVWSGPAGLFFTAILSVLEISLSFDNAIVNAAVLQTMDYKWRRRFLTWGMLFAVFGVRFLFPILIVAGITGLGLKEVTEMAFRAPDLYASHVTSAHVQISAFGGMYLLLVFLAFFFRKDKTLHWLGWLERRLSQVGKLESIEVIFALCVLLVAQHYLPHEERLSALLAGLAGVILFVLVKSVSALFEESGQVEKTVHKTGLMSFIYLELLDVSFSFDGVIGAFAITKDVVIIMVGLAIGAMFVRSLTLFFVQKGTLEEYLFLEHGAHYAIGSLALLMLADIIIHVSEILTASVGMVFILLALWSSIRYKNRRLAESG